MGDFLNCLRQPEYVHVVLNHLPITGLLAAVLALICALAIRSSARILSGSAESLVLQTGSDPASKHRS